MKKEVKNMVYIMLTSWVRPDKGKAFGKIVLEAIKKFPADESITKLILQAVSADEEGIKAFSISEVVKGKISEAMKRSSNLALFYAEAIGEGFKYEVETLMSAMEAMSVIGLEMPE